jgi:hypothetical protein
MFFPHFGPLTLNIPDFHGEVEVIEPYINNDLFEVFKGKAKEIIEEGYKDYLYFPSIDMKCVTPGENNFIQISCPNEDALKTLFEARIADISSSLTIRNLSNRDYDLRAIPFDDRVNPTEFKTDLCRKENIHARPNLVAFTSDDGIIKKWKSGKTILKIKCNFCCTASHFGSTFKCITLLLIFTPVKKETPVIISFVRSYTRSVHHKIKTDKERLKTRKEKNLISNTKENQPK